jgi:hypothetical protein
VSISLARQTILWNHHVLIITYSYLLPVTLSFPTHSAACSGELWRRTHWHVRTGRAITFRMAAHASFFASSASLSHFGQVARPVLDNRHAAPTAIPRDDAGSANDRRNPATQFNVCNTIICVHGITCPLKPAAVLGSGPSSVRREGEPARWPGRVLLRPDFDSSWFVSDPDSLVIDYHAGYDS